MQLSDATIQELLQKKGVAQESITNLVIAANKHKEPLQELAYKQKVISEAELTKLYADTIKAKSINLKGVKVNQEILNKIPERIARQYQAVLFNKKGNSYQLAIADPGDIQAVDFIEKLIGKNNIEIFIATESDIERVLSQYKSNFDTEITKVIPESEEVKLETVKAEDVAEDSPIAKTVNLLIEYAIKSGASDVHIEPREDSVQVRYRVDGLLREANLLPRNILAALVSRIKIMANLKIDEHRIPQDGRFKLKKNDRTVAIRVSTLPTMNGEKIVMRLLDETARALTLEELGFNASALSRMQNAMTQPHGMILVTGPTGSGKSTTLYSVLSALNTPEVNISTVEDPIEYHIPGVNQTQVNPQAGMTFASGLRALLRQDPNIIMVGEIRDSETADLAIQAALTGHLVLSTLHTNNAATALPRLLDMGAEPFLIASTVRVVIGQRLVRKLAPDGKESYTPDSTEMTELKERFHLTEAIEILKQQSKDVNIKQNVLKLYRPSKESLDKNNSGYEGRMGIYEVLEVSDNISQMIIQNATSDQIQEAATKEGMITMQQDGLTKCLQGLTTLEEILRVTRE